MELTAFKQEKLDYKLPVYLFSMPHTQAFTAHLAFPGGSVYEDKENNGVAHLLEHMVFKGGKKYPTRQSINNAVQMLGTYNNAYTAKDHVNYTMQGQGRYLMESLDILLDYVGNAHLCENDEDNFQKEKEVVYEEINRKKDNYPQYGWERLRHASFGNTSYGWATLGEKEILEKLEPKDLKNFKDKTYSLEKGGLFLAGNLENLDVSQLKQLLSLFEDNSDLPVIEPVQTILFEKDILEKDTNHSQLKMEFNAFIDNTNAKERMALGLYSDIMGGGSGSRLFEEIRENRGLCYSIGAYERHVALNSWSTVSVAAGLRSSSCLETIQLAKEILGNTNFDEGEFIRFKNESLTGWMLQQESQASMARLMVNRKLTGGLEEDPYESARALEELTLKDVKDISEKVELNDFSLSVIGPHKKEEFSAV